MYSTSVIQLALDIVETLFLLDDDGGDDDEKVTSTTRGGEIFFFLLWEQGIIHALIDV